MEKATNTQVYIFLHFNYYRKIISSLYQIDNFKILYFKVLQFSCHSVIYFVGCTLKVHSCGNLYSHFLHALGAGNVSPFFLISSPLSSCHTKFLINFTILLQKKKKGRQM
jgi:hypothetical protein